MRNLFLGMSLLLLGGSLVGCEEPARPKRPPSSSPAEDTSDDFRSRRRRGDTAQDEREVPEDRYAEDRSREERRRPEFRDRASSAAEEAEDERDAEADRPTSPHDE